MVTPESTTESTTSEVKDATPVAQTTIATQQARAEYAKQVETVRKREEAQAKEEDTTIGSENAEEKTSQASEDSPREKKERVDPLVKARTAEEYVVQEVQGNVWGGDRATIIYQENNSGGISVEQDERGRCFIILKESTTKPLTIDELITALNQPTNTTEDSPRVADLLDPSQLFRLKEVAIRIQDAMIIAAHDGKTVGVADLCNKAARLEQIAQDQIQIRKIPAPLQQRDEPIKVDWKLQELQTEKVVPVYAREFRDVPDIIQSLSMFEGDQQAREKEVRPVATTLEALLPDTPPVPESALVKEAQEESQEFDITKAQTNFSQQVFSEFAQYMTGRAVRFEEGNSITVNASQSEICIILPKNTSLSDIVEIARQLSPTTAFEVPVKIREFATKLQNTALLMAQQKTGEDAMFSPKAIQTVYHAGEQLETLTHPQDTKTKSIEEIQEEANKRKFEPEEKMELIFEMLYGQGSTVEKNGEAQQTPYQKLYHAVEVRYQREHDGQIPTEEQVRTIMFERITNEQNARRYAHVIETSLTGETHRARERMGQVAGQKNVEHIVEQAEVDSWIEAVQKTEGIHDERFKQTIDTALVEARLLAKSQGRETISRQDMLIAITRHFQSPQIADQLIYAPHKLLDVLRASGPQAGQEALWQAACNVKAAYALEAYRKAGFAAEPVLDGNHIYIVVKVDGKTFRADPSAPQQLVEKGIQKELSGVNEITDSQELEKADEAFTSQNGSEVIISSLWHNAAMELLEERGDKLSFEERARVISWLDRARAANPKSIISLYEKGKLFGNEEMMQQALLLDPTIAISAEKTGGKIGAYAVGALHTPPYNADVRFDALRLLESQINAKSGPRPIEALHSSELNHYSEPILKIIGQNSVTNPEVARVAIEMYEELGLAMDEAIKRERAEQAAARDEHPQMFRLRSQDIKQIMNVGNGGVMDWFEGQRVNFMWDWQPGRYPISSSFELFKAKTPEALTLAQIVSENSGVGTPGEKLLERFKQSENAVMAALSTTVSWQQGGDENLAKAKDGASQLGYKGINFILERDGLDEDGALVYMQRVANSRMEYQRLMDGRYLRTESMPVIRQDCIELIVDMAEHGEGEYAAVRDKIEKKVVIDKKTGKEFALGSTERAEALRQVPLLLRRRVEADYVLVSWVNTALMKEANIVGKGLPDLAGAEEAYEPRVAHAPYQDLVRWAIRDRAHKEMIFGTRDHEKDPPEQFEVYIRNRDNPGASAADRDRVVPMRELERYLGPARVHCVERVLKITNTIDTATMTIGDWYDAVETLSPLEYLSYAPDLMSSIWRIKRHVEGTKLVGGQKDGGVDNYESNYLMQAQREAVLQLRRLGGRARWAGRMAQGPYVYHADDFALGERLRILQTAQGNSPEKNNMVRVQRYELLSGKMATYMPDKMMKQMYDEDPLDPTFVAFFSSGLFAFLDGYDVPPGTPEVVPGVRGRRPPVYGHLRKGYCYGRPPEPGEVLLSPDQFRAQQRFEIFMHYYGSQLDIYRQKGYHQTIQMRRREWDAASGGWVIKDPEDVLDSKTGKPIYIPEQRNFGNFDTEAPDDYVALRKTMERRTGVAGFDHAAAFQDMMARMSIAAGSAPIASKLAGIVEDISQYQDPTDPTGKRIITRPTIRGEKGAFKHLGMHYLTMEDEDSLLHIDPIREKWLNTLNGFAAKSDIANPIGDRIGTLKAGEIIRDQVIKGNPNDPKTLFKAALDAGNAQYGLYGDDGIATVMYDHMGFYLYEIKLRGIFELSGVDARLAVASLAKEVYGTAVHGKTIEEILDMFENDLFPHLRGGGDSGKVLADELRKKLGLDANALWKNRSKKISIGLFVALMMELLSETVGKEGQAA